MAVIISLKNSSFLSCTVGRNSLLTQAAEQGSDFSEDLGKYESCIGPESPIGGTLEVPVMNFKRDGKETTD